MNSDLKIETKDGIVLLLTVTQGQIEVKIKDGKNEAEVEMDRLTGKASVMSGETK